MSNISIVFYSMQIIGCLLLAYTYRKHRAALRCEWDKVSAFIAFMVLATAGRYALMELAPPHPSEMIGNFRSLPLVFWEDAFFALPIWYMKDHLKLSKWFWGSFAVASSVLFATLHLPYGIAWAILTLTYPYYLSYKYGSKYGFGTIMACHILYDFITMLSVKLFLFLRYFMV